jgi:phytoene dehydrogenase-like protein
MAEFDGIVIGGGHNGLTCAAYLARAGARVAVLEHGPAIGGGTVTRELTGPGYMNNSCANYFIGFDASPITSDLELADHGFEYLVPEVQQAFLFSDERALVVHDEIDRTAEALGRFSSRDATEFRRRFERYEALRPLMVASMFSPPREVPSLAASAVADGLVPADVVEELGALRGLRPYDAIDEAFESEPIRVLLKKLIHVIQGTNAPGFGGIFPAMLVNLRRMCLPVGGSARLPEALASVVRANGGEVLTGTHVSRVVVEHGRAIGVEIEDGAERRALDADEFVVCAIDFPQMVGMLPGEMVPADVRSKADGWDWTGGQSLVTLHLALEEPPAYHATAYDPDVARAYNVSFGVDDSAGIVEAMRQLESGEFPELLVGNGACNSLFDPSYAPDGKHTAFWWPFASFAVDGDPSNWEARRDEYAERILDYWRRYAGNLTDENLVATALWTPYDVTQNNLSMQHGSVRMGPYTADQIGENRPHPDLADFRVPTVTGLYHCGSTSPNGGGVNGAPGYGAAGVIADDAGFDRWWPQMTVYRARELTSR